MTPPYHYRIYGLTVRSDFRLEEAEPCAPAAPDFKIVSADLARYARPIEGFRDFMALPAGDLFTFAGVGRFLVSDTAEISVDIDAGFDVRLLALPLLGPVIAVLLHRRGYLVLHGSAIELNGRAEVFLGDKGAGKSTTAASLVAAGRQLIADDVVAIRLGDGEPDVPAGYQAMKLDTALKERFGAGDGHVIEPADGLFTGGKIRFRLDRRNPPNPLPLGRVHVLERGPVNAIRPRDHAQALQALIRFSYFPRLGPASLEGGDAAILFTKAARLATIARIDTLTVRDDLSTLPELAHFLGDAELRDHAIA